jgi:hypothetical protein
MNPSTYPRMNPGDHLDAMPRRFWNKLVDICNWFDRTEAIGAADYKKPPAFRPCDAVRIKNATETDLDKGAIVAISGSVYDPTEETHLDYFKAAPVLVGSAPVYPDHIGRFAVLLQPLGMDEVGYGAITGMVWCQVEMDFQGRPYADISTSGVGPTSKLYGNEYGGAEILYIEGMNDAPEDWTAGTKHALVRIGSFNNPTLIVSWDGTIEFGTEKEAVVHNIDGPTERTIPLFASIIGSFSGDAQEIATPGEMATAFFHRESGIFELTANTRMLDMPPP